MTWVVVPAMIILSFIYFDMDLPEGVSLDFGRFRPGNR